MHDRLRIPWNALSPFRDELAQLGERGDAKDVRRTDAVAEPRFRDVAATLAAPDVRITHRLATAADAPVTFTACMRRDDANRVVLVRSEGDGAVRIHVLGSIHAYLVSWLTVASSRAATPIPNDVPPPSPLGELMLALHTADTYRRAKRLREASYDTQGELTVTNEELATTLSDALTSRNAGWLLPAFLSLTPGIDAAHVVPRAPHVLSLATRTVLMPRPQGAGMAPRLAFGEAGTRLGEEFLGGVEFAAGLEIALWTPRGSTPYFRGFLAATPRANHLIEVSAAGDDTHANHQAMTQRRLLVKLTALVTAALHPDAPDRVLARAAEDTPTTRTAATASKVPGPAQRAATEAKRACPSCGFANPFHMKFCGECGGSLQSPPRTARASRPTTCTNCGHEVPAGKRFCTNCGEQLAL
jgi:hypothetical protein